MSILEIVNLSFSYPEKMVLNDICLSMQEGEILCLLGQNGCGKTTLLDTVMGIHPPKSGKVFIENKDISSLSRKEIAFKAAFVPQIHTPTFPYTVKEMVIMGRTSHLGAFCHPTSQDYDICYDAMCQTGIEKFADRAYGSLSGGEIKLVLLARAICQQAKIFIMDEPTAHLDFKNELIFLNAIEKMVHDKKISVLMATHNPSHPFFFENGKISVKTAMMKNGCVMCFGTPKETLTEENLFKLYDVNTCVIRKTSENGEFISAVVPLNLPLGGVHE